MIFGAVTGKAISGNLTNLENANKVVKTINSVSQYMDKHKAVKYALNITGDVVTGCVDDYIWINQSCKCGCKRCKRHAQGLRNEQPAV